jgi:hypothetical protein
MTSTSKGGGTSIFRTLQRLARPRSDTEVCEFCSVPLHSGHRHLLEMATRKIVCACDPCALRFENVIGRWKLIPRDPQRLHDFQMPDPDWEALALPINLVFIFHSTPAGRVIALYPSPAGATESLVPISSWGALAKANPILEGIQADVEALLVNRLAESPRYYIAPIDLCFELAGLIRLHWRGLSGGSRVWEEMERFFTTLEARVAPFATRSAEVAHA